MHITDETAINWIHIENIISKFLVAHPNVGNMYLDTVIFKEEHLKASVQIQNFVNSTKLKFGCSIIYSKVESALYGAGYGNNVSENDFKAKLEIHLCQPVFQLVSVMVWLAPNYGKTGALFSYYSDLFLAREIFLAHFPNMTILIQFTSDMKIDKTILADLYSVPIVIPSNELLF